MELYMYPMLALGLSVMIQFLFELYKKSITTKIVKEIEHNFNTNIEILRIQLETSKHKSIKQIDEEIELLLEFKNLYFIWIQSLMSKELRTSLIEACHEMEYLLDKNQYEFFREEIVHRMKKVNNLREVYENNERNLHISLTKINLLIYEEGLLQKINELPRITSDILELPIRTHIINVNMRYNVLRFIDESEEPFPNLNLYKEECKVSYNDYENALSNGTQQVKPYYKLFNENKKRYIDNLL